MSILPISLYDCYDYVIGLSRTECDCYDPKGDFTLDYNTSLSGLYLDELLPITVMNSLEYCENDIWELMDRARENAIIAFTKDATRELMKWNKLRTKPYTGVIGRRTNTRDRGITNTYAGVHLVAKDIVAGNITIKKIYTCFNYTGNVTVRITDNLGNVYDTNILVTTEDTWVENDITDIELPLHSDLVDNLEYFIYYELAAGQDARNNDICCNCSKLMTFCANRPYFTRSHSDTYAWANSVMIGGFTTSDISRFTDVTFDYGGNNFMNGLNLEVDVNCDVGQVLCRDAMNYESDPLATATAFAIRWKAAEMLVDSLFMSPKLNFSKLVNRESLATEQADWVKKYTEAIEYIGQDTDITNTDCLMCKDLFEINKGTIYS